VRARSVALCAQRASVRSLHAHTAPPTHTESIESAQVLSSKVPHGLSCNTPEGAHMRSPFVSLTTVVFFRVPFRSRAPPPTSPPPSSPPPRASLPRDCPILRTRAGLPLSRGPVTLTVRDDSFGATRRTRFPSSLRHSVGCCMSTPRHFKRPSSLKPLLWSHTSMLPNVRMQPKDSLFSLVRRMIATLINCVAEKISAHSHNVLSLAFSPDGTKIVSGSADGMIKVWDSGAPRAQNRPSLATTDACWLVWQTNWRC